MIERQLITIPMSGGVDTKTDDKQILPTKLSALQNGVFQNPKKIRKRYGYTNLLTAGLSGTSVPVGIGVLDNELVFTDSKYCYSYLNDTAFPSTLKLLSAVSPAMVTVTEFLNSQNSQITPDLVTVGGQDHLCCLDNPNIAGQPLPFVQIAIVKDASTGSILRSESRGIAGSTPEGGILNLGRILPYAADASKSIIFAARNPNPGFGVFKSIDGLQTSGNTGLTGNNQTPTGYPTRCGYFDVVAGSASPYFMAVASLPTNPGTGSVVIARLDNTGTQTAQVSLAFGTSAQAITNICLIESGTNIFVFAGIFGGGNTGLVYAVVDSTTLATVKAPAKISSQTATNITAVSEAADSVRVVFDNVGQPGSPVAPVTHDNAQVFALVVSSAAVTTSQYAIVLRGALATKAFRFGGETYLNLFMNSVTQGLAYTLRIDSAYGINVSAPTGGNQNIVARFLAGASAGSNFDHSLPGVQIIGNKVQFAMGKRTQVITSAGNASQFRTGVVKVVLAFSDPRFIAQSIALDSTIFQPGAIPQFYDSLGYVDSNFLYAPETLSGNISGTAGSLSTGTYLYYAVLEWRDSKGQVHLSAPSIPKSVPVTTGQAVDLNVNSAVVSMKENLPQGLRMVREILCTFYRTTANGGVAHRINNFAPPFYYATDGVTSTFTDVLSDADISGNEILYTTGGVLANDSAPACKFGTVFDARIFLGGLEDASQIAFSKTYLAGTPVEFSDEFRLNVPKDGGDVTALKAMDDKLIIFKQDRIHYMYGTGPDNLGQGSAYSPILSLSSPVGCGYPKSVVATPDGLIFKSDKGVYLLDRALQAQYIGAEVEAYNSQNILSATLLTDQNQVRFLTDGGIALVYDYFVRQWSVFTNHSGVGAVLYKGQASVQKYTYLRSDGNGMVYQENTGFLDDLLQIQLIPTTAWVRVCDLQGFQRARRLGFLGSIKGSATISVAVSHDFKSTDQTAQFGPLAVSAVGQEMVHLRVQKCECVQFRVFDNPANLISAGQFIVGHAYTILIAGSTDWNAIGLRAGVTPSNGVTFTATGAGSGSGLAFEAMLEGYDISGLTLEVGVKRGLKKLSSANTTG